MSVKWNGTETVGVILVRPGAGREEYELPGGSTVADLLRAAHASPDNQDVLIGDRALAESLPLHPGMVISIVPRVRNASGSWRELIDQPGVRQAFEEVMQAVNEERESEKEKA